MQIDNQQMTWEQIHSIQAPKGAELAKIYWVSPGRSYLLSTEDISAEASHNPKRQ